MAKQEGDEEIQNGHKLDDRFSSGSKGGDMKIVRPSTTAKVTPAKYEADRKWNLGSNHAIK